MQDLLDAEGDGLQIWANAREISSRKAREELVLRSHIGGRRTDRCRAFRQDELQT